MENSTMETSSGKPMDRGKRCQRPRRGSRMPRAKRGKRREALLVDVSGSRRVSVEEIPAEAVVDHVADAYGVGPPIAAHHGGEDFVCDLLEVFPQPAANMIWAPIPSPAEEIHLRAQDQ